jgi:hypothetical protein
MPVVAAVAAAATAVTTELVAQATPTGPRLIAMSVLQLHLRVIAMLLLLRVMIAVMTDMRAGLLRCLRRLLRATTEATGEIIGPVLPHRQHPAMHAMSTMIVVLCLLRLLTVIATITVLPLRLWLIGTHPEMIGILLKAMAAMTGMRLLRLRRLMTAARAMTVEALTIALSTETIRRAALALLITVVITLLDRRMIVTLAAEAAPSGPLAPTTGTLGLLMATDLALLVAITALGLTELGPAITGVRAGLLIAVTPLLVHRSLPLADMLIVMATEIGVTAAPARLKLATQPAAGPGPHPGARRTGAHTSTLFRPSTLLAVANCT